MLSAIEVPPLLQLKSHARAYHLPHTMHLLLLLKGIQSGLMLEVHQPISMLLVLMDPQRQALLLWGLPKLRLVVLIVQHGVGRLLVVCNSGHHAAMCLLLLLLVVLVPLSLQLARQ